MWSLELGASPEIAYSAARRRAHDLRAAAFAAAIARIARPLAAIFRRRRHRPLFPEVAPVQTEGVFDARADSVAAIGSAADTDEEPLRQASTAPVRLVLTADAEPPVLIDRTGTVATLMLNRPERLNAIDYRWLNVCSSCWTRSSKTGRSVQCS